MDEVNIEIPDIPVNSEEESGEFGLLHSGGRHKKKPSLAMKEAFEARKTALKNAKDTQN